VTVRQRRRQSVNQDVDVAQTLLHSDEEAQFGKENAREDRKANLAEKLGLLNLDEGGLNLDACEAKIRPAKSS
jgi:hypothetical protein